MTPTYHKEGTHTEYDYQGSWSRCADRVLLLQSPAQFKDQGLGGGVGFGGTFGRTELKDQEARFLARAFLRYGIFNHLTGEFGVGIGRVGGSSYKAQIIPIDYRFVLSPFSVESWNPYLYAGFGALNFLQEQVPPHPTPGVKTKGWTAFVPAGIGLQVRLNDRVSFETSGGYNHTFTDDLNSVRVGQKDAYFNFLVGLTVSGVERECRSRWRRVDKQGRETTRNRSQSC